MQMRLTRGYCIDTSALIDLWRKHYPPDVFPSLWKDIEKLVSQGSLIASQEVFNEVKKRDDELLRWANTNKKMFVDLDAGQLQQVGIVLKDFPQLVDTKKTTPDADPFVIALARSRGWAIITSETPNPGGRPHIPDVCKRYNVRWISLMEFFREKGWKY